MVKKLKVSKDHIFFYKQSCDFFEKKDFAAARAPAERAVKLMPSHALYQFQLAKVYFETNLHEEAYSIFNTAKKQGLSQLEKHHFHLWMGKAELKLKQLFGAVNSFTRQIELTPKQLQPYLFLADICDSSGESERAIEILEAAHVACGESADLYAFVGHICLNNNATDVGVDYLNKAIKLDPKNILALGELNHTFFNLRQFQSVLQISHVILRLDPQNASAYFFIASAYKASGQINKALKYANEGVKKNPSDERLWGILASTYLIIGDTTKRKEVLEKLYKLTSSIQVKASTLVASPPILSSCQQIKELRTDILLGLDSLLSGELKEETPLHPPNYFYLTYHGENNRVILEKLGQIYSQIIPKCQALLKGPRQKRLRIGFISAYFRKHTIEKLYRGLINKLPRDQFEVILLNLSQDISSDESVLENAADQCILLTGAYEKNCDEILSLKLDLLFYPDIGMHTTSYFYALQRLAPIQCMGWGHPDTSGLSTIDYFISAKDLETDRSQEHYTEKLIQLDHLPSYYYKPDVSDESLCRSDFGLDKAANLYTIPQSLFKVHPAFDAILLEILNRDTNGQLVFINMNNDIYEQQILDRFEKLSPGMTRRVHILAHMETYRYYNLARLSNVILDTPYFGGGNSIFELMAVGTPIVSLPNEFMRTKICYACYEKMGIKGCVASNAEEYIEMTTHIATNDKYRKCIQEQILKRNEVLYEDPQVINEYAKMLESLILHR